MFAGRVSNLWPLHRFTSGLRTMAYIPKNRLQGKVAVVTASTDGIGFGIAKRLAQEGAHVVISSRKQKNVDAALRKLSAEGLTVTGRMCHVSDAEHRRNLFEEANTKYGGIDILVSNAAANPAVGPALESDEKAWDKTFEINVRCSFLLAKEALPYIRKRGGGGGGGGGGRIIFVSSIAGYQPFDALGAYSVTKTTLIGLTKAASQSLGPENITVNCIAPGIIETKFSSALWQSDAAREATLAQIPMSRLGTPDDISGVAAFLASDDARYVTGETIVVAGGMASRL